MTAHGLLPTIVQLVILETSLSLDNAAVLAAMVQHLPDHEPVPWPHRLSPAGGLDPVLGNQRRAAIRVGLLGAYAGRALMLVFAVLIVRNLWLRLLGAGYLLYLTASQLLSARGQDTHPGGHGPPRGGGFWRTVLYVELADLALSLDNVVAAVALSNRLGIVVLGVGLGILTMRLASTGMLQLIARWPSLGRSAYLLVGAIGLELLARDLGGVALDPRTQLAVNASVLAVGALLLALRGYRDSGS